MKKVSLRMSSGGQNMESNVAIYQKPLAVCVFSQRAVACFRYRARSRQRVRFCTRRMGWAQQAAYLTLFFGWFFVGGRFARICRSASLEVPPPGGVSVVAFRRSGAPARTGTGEDFLRAERPNEPIRQKVQRSGGTLSLAFNMLHMLK